MNRMYIDNKDRRSIVGEFCPELCNVQQKYWLEPVDKENICGECLCGQLSCVVMAFG
jgi:hypothetical protein